MIHIKTNEELALMRESGKRLAEVFKIIKELIKPGINLLLLHIRIL